MRNSDTYKGFVYQKKCAFLLLLRELADETGVKAFRMEHPKGDDVDLIYSTSLRVFQTKDVQTPNLGEYLGKMWRRYTENMQPGESRTIALGFIFSLHHDTDACFKALKECKADDATLVEVLSGINKDPLARVKVGSEAEWQEFLRPITVQVLELDELERELERSLNFMFLQYRLPQHEIKSLRAEFLGRLDEVMQNGREVPEREVRELIDQWFVRYCNLHPLMRERTRQSFAAGLAQMDRNEPARPSVSGSGMI